MPPARGPVGQIAGPLTWEYPQDADYYKRPRPPRPALPIRQGDLYRAVPTAVIAFPAPSVPLPARTSGLKLPGPATKHTHPERLEVAGVREAYALLVQHTCDFAEKEAMRVRLVALVQPLADIPSPAHQEAIRSGSGARNTYYLPAIPELDFPESFADFRFISSVNARHLTPVHRLAALTDVARVILIRRLLLYFTRFLFPLEALWQAEQDRMANDPAAQDPPEAGE